MVNMQQRPDDPRNQVVRAHAQLNQAKVPQDRLLTQRLGVLLDKIDYLTSPLIPESMLTAGTLARVNVVSTLALSYHAWLEFTGLRQQAMAQMGKLVEAVHPKTGEKFLHLPGETPEHILQQIDDIYMAGHEDAASHIADPENYTDFELFLDVIYIWHTNNGGSLGAWLNEQGERPQGLAHLYLHWKAWKLAKPEAADPKPITLELNGIDLTGHSFVPAEPLPDSEAPRKAFEYNIEFQPRPGGLKLDPLEHPLVTKSGQIKLSPESLIPPEEKDE